MAKWGHMSCFGIGECYSGLKFQKNKIVQLCFAQFLIFQPIVDGHFRHGEYKSLASVSHMISAKRKSLGETWVFLENP